MKYFFYSYYKGTEYKLLWHDILTILWDRLNLKIFLHATPLIRKHRRQNECKHISKERKLTFKLVFKTNVKFIQEENTVYLFLLIFIIVISNNNLTYNSFMKLQFKNERSVYEEKIAAIDKSCASKVRVPTQNCGRNFLVEGARCPNVRSFGENS